MNYWSFDNSAQLRRFREERMSRMNRDKNFWKEILRALLAMRRK